MRTTRSFACPLHGQLSAGITVVEKKEKKKHPATYQ